MFIISVVDSSGFRAIHRVELSEGETLVIGRSPDCEIPVVQEGTLSRRHAIITLENGRLLVKDNNSVNGITLKGQPVLVAPLIYGCTYMLGNCALSLLEEDPEAVPEPEPAPEPEPEYTPEPEPAAEPEPADRGTGEVAAPVPVAPVVAAAPLAAIRRRAGAVPSVVQRAQEARDRAIRNCTRKSVAPRAVRTAAPAGPRAERPQLKITNGLPDVSLLVPENQMPLCTSGDYLDMPVDFRLLLKACVARYPLQGGDELMFSLRSDTRCYVCLVQYDSQGEHTLIVPGVAGENTIVPPDCDVVFPSAARSEYLLTVDPPYGDEVIVALACTQPCDFLRAYQATAPTLGPCPLPGRLECAIREYLEHERKVHGASWSSSVLQLQSVAPPAPEPGQTEQPAS